MREREREEESGGGGRNTGRFKSLSLFSGSQCGCRRLSWQLLVFTCVLFLPGGRCDRDAGTIPNYIVAVSEPANMNATLFYLGCSDVSR